MQAIVCHELSGPAALRLTEIAEPFPGPGQVRIRVRACGVNFADSLITRGQYQKQPQPPFSPGFEVSGEILELGAGVNGVVIGQRVIAMTPHGGYAEQVIADITRCVAMPAVSYTHLDVYKRQPIRWSRRPPGGCCMAGVPTRSRRATWP